MDCCFQDDGELWQMGLRRVCIWWGSWWSYHFAFRIQTVSDIFSLRKIFDFRNKFLQFIECNQNNILRVELLPQSYQSYWNYQKLSLLHQSRGAYELFQWSQRHGRFTIMPSMWYWSSVSLLTITIFRGVNNSFLISMRHTKALRYNDKSVLENHHCAIAFKLLLDPKNDIFELLSEA